MINIVTIDYDLEGEKIVNTNIDGDETLLDADLVIIEPKNFNRLWKKVVRENNDGTPRVYSPQSDRIRNTFESRRNEIETLLENGKIIICFLSPIKGFYGEINDKSNYNIVTNYDFLPLDQQFLLEHLKSGKGAPKSIKEKNRNLFSPYFSAFKNELEYTAYLDYETDDKNINFLVNRSDKPVGFTYQNRNGLIALLPPIPYKRDNKKLINTLVNSIKNHINKHTVTPPPNWVSEFSLKGEQEYDIEIKAFNTKITKIEDERLKVIELKKELTKFKSLLYEQGPELENAVMEAFKLMGFKAFNRKLDDLEHDIVFESAEGKGLAELEGKDNNSIHISKLDQLNRAIDEDFELTGTYSQGLLIGNHYRFTKPKDRKEPFTEKVYIVAKKKNFGLLTTTEIYKAVENILNSPENEELKENYRKMILTTVGDNIKLT